MFSENLLMASFASIPFRLPSKKIGLKYEAAPGVVGRSMPAWEVARKAGDLTTLERFQSRPLAVYSCGGCRQSSALESWHHNECPLLCNLKQLLQPAMKQADTLMLLVAC